MANWIEAIYDRTEEDIVNKTAKGHLSYSDLLRIENNMNFVAERLGIEISVKDWSQRPIPTERDLQRILDNLDTIKSNWNLIDLSEVPTMPLNTYQKVNVVEEIIHTIKINITQADDAYVRCGECYAGEIGVI